MKKKIKVGNMTLEQYERFVLHKRWDEGGPCSNCTFRGTSCSKFISIFWEKNKDLFTKEYLDQEIEVEEDD